MRADILRHPVSGVALMLLVILVAAACGATGSLVPSQPAASPAVPAPTAVADPAGAPAPTPVPTAEPEDGAIRLDTADGHDVVVVVSDPGKLFAGARAARAGDGMSVRWGDVDVVNVDEDTIRVTWVGLPVDARITLDVASAAGGLELRFTQPAPPANSDAVGFDRVLELDLAQPVDAASVSVSFIAA